MHDTTDSNTQRDCSATKHSVLSSGSVKGISSKVQKKNGTVTPRRADCHAAFKENITPDGNRRDATYMA